MTDIRSPKRTTVFQFITFLRFLFWIEIEGSTPAIGVVAKEVGSGECTLKRGKFNQIDFSISKSSLSSDDHSLLLVWHSLIPTFTEVFS